MFFLLSKILDTLVTPLAWAVALVAYAVVTRRPPAFRRLLAALGLVVLVGFSLEPVANALLRSLETPPLRSYHPDVTYDVVILLGGVGNERVQATWGERAYNDNNERLLETFDLLRAGKTRNAIVSGGPGLPEHPETDEARALVDQLLAWGIDKDRLFVEPDAKNTRENATLSAAIVRDRGWKKVLIVTSAMHMPRAYGCFKAVGLDVDTLPVDFRSFAPTYPASLMPRADYLQESSVALREGFGRFVYRVRGYSK